ncbi:MAG: hypothetical protein R3F54_09585 [Alphaproteobacteria bacterium]
MLSLVWVSSCQAEQSGEALLQVRIVGDLAADVAVHPAEIGLEAPDLAAHPAVLRA